MPSAKARKGYYFERRPSASLREFVRCIWTYQTDVPSNEAQPVPPDGCAELIVHLGRPYAELSSTGRVTQPPILFAGQITQPLTLHATGRVCVLGVRFEPDGARAFIGQPLATSTDVRRDLRAIHGRQAATLLRIVRAAKSWDERIATVETYVGGAIKSGAIGIDSDVRDVVCQLEYNLGEPAKPLTQRQLQRRFKEHVGVSPRTLATIFRFRQLFNAIERPEHPGWLDAALSVGYFDQPHMARDFRRYLGCTATEWARRKAGLSTLLAQPVSESYKPPREPRA